MATVRGTQKTKPLELEFGKTTVYERKNIRRVDEDDTEHKEQARHCGACRAISGRKGKWLRFTSI